MPDELTSIGYQARVMQAKPWEREGMSTDINSGYLPDRQSYREEVAMLAQALFGLTLDDLVDDAQLHNSWHGDETPLELVERLGTKYDLVRIDQAQW